MSITARTAARGALAVVVLGSTVGGNVLRWRERRDEFAKAQARALATGRTLVVVGDPHGGMVTRALPAYGRGDVCLDLNACPACPVNEAVNLDTGRASVPDNSAVVYVSCVLEYVADPQASMREIGRMAGSPDNVFIVSVQPWTLAARFYPGARQTISRTADGGIVASPVTTTQKVLLGGALLGLAVVAFGPRRKGERVRR